MTTTCQEIGLVSEITAGGIAVVTVRRAEACHSCSAKGACMSLGSEAKDLVVSVENTVGARPGDQVTLHIAEGSVMKASFVLYLVPAVGLVCGAVAGLYLFPGLGLGEDPASIVGSFVGLGAGLLTSRLLGKKMGKDRKYRPTITSIVSRADTAAPTTTP